MAENNSTLTTNLVDSMQVNEVVNAEEKVTIKKDCEDTVAVLEEVNLEDTDAAVSTEAPIKSTTKGSEVTSNALAAENERHSTVQSKEVSKDNASDCKISGAIDEEKAAKQTKQIESTSQNKNIDIIISEEEEKLNEILKIVNDNLDVKNLPKSADESETMKRREDEGSKVKEIVVAEDSKKDSKEDCSKGADEKVGSIETTRLKEVGQTSEKIDERSEVGIVGPPTAVSELINEEELRAESALSTEQKLQDHVAEWVQNSVKAEALITAEVEEEENNVQDDNLHRRKNLAEKRGRKKKSNEIIVGPTRKSQRIVTNIIKRSIKCLNKMHAMESAGGNGKKVDAAEKTKEDDSSQASPKVPQSQQNGAALPEETAAATTAADRLRSMPIKKEHHGRKRKSTDGQPSSNGTTLPSKKPCLVERREEFITSLVGSEKVTAEELAVRADQLRSEVQALDELARAKEMEWNEILSMRKLKEEAYLRVERRRQVMGFMESNEQLPDAVPPASMALSHDWESSGNTTPVSKEKCSFESKEDLPEENSQDSTLFKKEKNAKSASQRQSTPPPKQGGENGRKQAEALSPDNRQIGEGRQGAIVDVRSIIADYRLRHPETVPRRGRRMRNSVNVGLGAGGAMVETGHSVDSRPSSTDSCKSNPNAVDPNNSMSFKDVLVQFAKLSQQQGEPVKTPQNYPDVTLHPVAPTPVTQNAPPQQTGSLLHGILTKSQSPRPTTFSPTLARLLTAPERERNAPTPTSIPQQSAATQHLLQAYQGSNPVSISDLLSSSKARTEITITPVVNTPAQSHSNNLIHVDDVEEETAVIEDRETRMSGGRDNRDDRDSPPRCQGCQERAAQFVCAGCGNQWYCSRECQVAAWDEHSEVCSG